MKFPIEWHEQCLQNMRASYERNLKRHEEEKARLNREYVGLAIYEGQILKAKAAGKDGFDREKYGFRRSPSAAQGSGPQEKT